MDRVHSNFCKLFAYIEYETPEEAEKAVKYMDGGKSVFKQISLYWLLPISAYIYPVSEHVSVNIVYDPSMENIILDSINF